MNMADHKEFEVCLRPLWLRAQAGDEPAYREALMLAAGRLRVFFARRLASSPDEVEDLVQETLLALHLQRGTYDPGLPVSAWLHAIARHKLIDALRRNGRTRSYLEPLDDLPEEMMPTAACDSNAGRDLAQLLSTLPLPQARSIHATKLAGYSVAEAAAELGLSESLVKINVHRGLKRLAQLIRGKV
jgi:RNA polymerase sigma-70 factor (ECF subfamily)